MNAIKDKIKKSSKAVLLFSRILRIIMIVSFCFVLAVTILTAIAPSSKFSLINSDYVLITGSPDLVLEGSGSLELTSTVTALLLTAVVPALFSIGIIIFILYLAERIFKNIYDSQSPFERVNVKKLKNIAWLMLAFTIIPTYVETVLRFFLMRNTASPYNFSIDITTICLTVIFFALAYIFEYGCLLQQQYDETL